MMARYRRLGETKVFPVDEGYVPVQQEHVSVHPAPAATQMRPFEEPATDAKK